MSEIKDKTINFLGLSVGQFQAKSIVGSGDEKFSGYSITASFNPLRSLSPTESDAATIAQFVSTLAMDLLKDPS